MTIIRNATLADAPAIMAIYNQGINEGRATFETRPRSLTDIEDRLAEGPGFPVFVAADHHATVLGWAGLSAYRARACYAGIAEFSVYLDQNARGQGLGRALLNALLERAAVLGYWKVLSRVFTFNHASRAMCAACGFREVGIYEKHGRLNGQWLDVVIVERLITENLTDLTYPATP